ncbi:hypothetical protein N9006_02220, partial [bacterium]|nr:hypothetical protein [bacterium]
HSASLFKSTHLGQGIKKLQAPSISEENRKYTEGHPILKISDLSPEVTRTWFSKFRDLPTG